MMVLCPKLKEVAAENANAISVVHSACSAKSAVADLGPHGVGHGASFCYASVIPYYGHEHKRADRARDQQPNPDEDTESQRLFSALGRPGLSVRSR